MKLCSRCRERKEEEFFSKDKYQKDGLKNTCKLCSAEMNRRYFVEHGAAIRVRRVKYRQELSVEAKRRTSRRRRASSPEKFSARWKLQYAVRKGRVLKKPCEVCGALKVEAHHPDYSQPLNVVWLCRVHHCKVHHGWN